MRDKFSELIEQGVASFHYTTIAPDVPEQDAVSREYNNIFSIPSDTHMTYFKDGRRVITGHMINKKRDWDKFLYSCFWGAVDFRTTGYYSLDDFLYKHNLRGQYGRVNNDVVYIITPCTPKELSCRLAACTNIYDPDTSF